MVDLRQKRKTDACNHLSLEELQLASFQDQVPASVSLKLQYNQVNKCTKLISPLFQPHHH